MPRPWDEVNHTIAEISNNHVHVVINFMHDLLSTIYTLEDLLLFNRGCFALNITQFHKLCKLVNEYFHKGNGRYIITKTLCMKFFKIEKFMKI